MFISKKVFIYLGIINKQTIMTVLNKTVETFRNEVTGFTYLFECDSELTLDLTGQIVDYSGMGSERAEKYATQLR